VILAACRLDDAHHPQVLGVEDVAAVGGVSAEVVEGDADGDLPGGGDVDDAPPDDRSQRSAGFGDELHGPHVPLERMVHRRDGRDRPVLHRAHPHVLVRAIGIDVRPSIVKVVPPALMPSPARAQGQPPAGGELHFAQVPRRQSAATAGRSGAGLRSPERIANVPTSPEVRPCWSERPQDPRCRGGVGFAARWHG
jgi:hypothetical protein